MFEYKNVINIVIYYLLLHSFQKGANTDVMCWLKI